MLNNSCTIRVIATLLLVTLIGFSVMLTFGCKSKQESAVQVENTLKNSTNSSLTSTIDTLKSDSKYILFFGNSLTAGYGLDEDQSFPTLIQKRIDSLHLNYIVINAGLSGETSSGGKNRIDWVLKHRVDIFVLELGANDVLRGLDLKETKANLKAILDKVRSSNSEVKIILAGMQAPPNMGNDYTRQFASIYPSLAKEYNASLIPFLLQNVGGIPALNLADGKHPNAEGQYIVRENVWKVLKHAL
ncbi:MAG: arylesterase [Saprospiraceae bacterium]